MYRVFDPSGKAVAWLRAGRKLRVWRSAEIGANRPDQLTPGDVETPPHWAYPLADSTVHGPGDVEIMVRFRIAYEPGVKTHWQTDCPSAWRAAENAPAKVRAAALKRMRTSEFAESYLASRAFTVERVLWRTYETGLTSCGVQPVGCYSGVAIIEWIALPLNKVLVLEDA